MSHLRFIYIILTCLFGNSVFSQNIEFIENKGQWDPQVKYMGQIGAGAFYIHSDGFTVVQHDPKDWGKLHELSHNLHAKKTKAEDHIVKSHSYRVKLHNASTSAKIVADKPLYTYNNYFIGNDPSKWASNCKIYQGVTVHDVYPNVDIRYYSDGGAVKYDFIVKPGANLNDISLKYEGQDNIKVKNKELVIETSVGVLRELEPYSYKYDDKGKVDVAVKYALKGNVVKFDVKNYDPKSTLIIDPSIIFCSFSGSTANNWGYTATYGTDGSMYGGGIIAAQGFPWTGGAHQTSYGGGEWDIAVIKLSPDGSKKQYATFIGGSGIDQPHSLVVDPQGNLILAGRSNSANYPTRGENFGVGGSYDIVVTKFNATGTDIIGSKRIGGKLDDGVNITTNRNGSTSLQQNYGDDGRSEVILDGAGNVYVASATQSSDFHLVNPFQSTIGGLQDGVVLKLSPDLSTMLFSSYLGGSKNDAAYVLTLHPSTGDIYVAGGTESSDFPSSANGPTGNTNKGEIDGFISIIRNNGSALIHSIYLGTAAIDQIFGIQFDNLGFPYVMGQTRGTWPIRNAAWSQPNGKQFISKLLPDLSDFVYSTVFGKGETFPDISPVAFLVDRCENVYISGWGGNLQPGYSSAETTGLPVTPDAFKSTTDGDDFYFFVLKKDATAQLFGSFFGQNGGQGDHVDGGTSRFDKNGIIYQAMCANCNGGVSFPTTSGVWAPTKPGSAYCNLAMLKIDLDLSGVRGQIQSAINGVVKRSGCSPLTVDFKDTIQTAKNYEWVFSDGSPRQFTNTPNITHTFNRPGTYTVRMVAIDLEKCITRDSSELTIIVSDNKMDLDFNFIKQNPCESFRYEFNNLSLPQAGTSTSTTSFTWDFGDGSPRQTTNNSSLYHTFPAAGTYNVKLILNDPFYCNSPDSIVKQLRVAAMVKADFETPPNSCAPFAVTFKNTSEAGAQFLWNFGDGNISNDRSPSHTYTGSGTYTITLTVTDPATCNITDTKQAFITVFDKPTAAFTHSTPAINTPVSFTNTSSPDAVRFTWQFGDGDSLLTASRSVVQHEYNITGKYTACLTAYNANGCADKTCTDLNIEVETAVDVPTAFTPLSGDINSRIFVRGYGISKMKFIIWSRWGEKVFESDDKKNGWDGTFKGKLLPMDVYAYTLDVEFFDGVKTRKKGDITLIR